MSSYLQRYNHYLSPTRDYMTIGLFDDSPVERRRPPQPRYRALHYEEVPRPSYHCPCLMDQRTVVEEEDDDPPPVFFNTYKAPLCTPNDLLKIIRKKEGHYQLPIQPYNEVYPNLFISDALTAMSPSLLKRMRITHIVNAAQGAEKNCGFINTSADFYTQAGIKFLGVPAFDNPAFRIHRYFDDAAEFIDRALNTGGKVLVHCQSGISRSATLVIAFLMLKRGLLVKEAVKAVREHRAIIPNKGFLQQLCDLNDKLVRGPDY